MKIVHCASGSSITELQESLQEYGHTVVGIDDPDTDADFIFGWSVIMMPETFQARRKFTNAKLIVYCWDVYEWVWTTPRPGEYNYGRYCELMRMADEVWCPSSGVAECIQRRCNITKMHILKTAIPYYDYSPITDGGFLLNPLRKLPDRQHGWFERACEELGIPYLSPDHGLKWAEYQAAVASARMVVSPYYEASTGGLTCLEAYHLGKPVLLCDSPYNGAKEYFGDRAVYFKGLDYDDMKAKLREYFDNPPSVAPDYKEWVEANFSKKVMAAEMQKRLLALKGENNEDGNRVPSENTPL